MPKKKSSKQKPRTGMLRLRQDTYDNTKKAAGYKRLQIAEYAEDILDKQTQIDIEAYETQSK